MKLQSVSCAAFLLLLGTTVHAALATPTIVWPINNQTVSGITGMYGTVDTPANVKSVSFWYAPVSGAPQITVAQFQAPPYKFVGNTKTIPDGAYLLGMTLTDINNAQASAAILVHVLNGTGTPTCQDMLVYVQNKSSQEVFGSLSVLSAAGLHVVAGGTQLVNIPIAMPGPPTNYSVNANFFGTAPASITCSGTVPVVNGCPAKQLDAGMVILPGVTPAAPLSCQIGAVKAKS